jgi:hypothetical protein
MAALRATSPDGREWEITIHRVRLPRWRHSEYDPWDDATDFVSGVFAFVVLVPFFWFILPLAQALAELPVAVARSFFSSTRWVEATSRTTSEITIVWRTRRDRVHEVADYIARTLPHGYEDLTPQGAELISMTRPPGLEGRAS